MKNPTSNQFVVITGGASGLGKAMVEAFAATGSHVIIADIHHQRGHKLVAELNSKGGNVQFLPCDISKEIDALNLATFVKANWPQIDLLINNAGVATAGILEYEDIEQWRWVLNINLLGMVRITRAIVPLMKKQQFGSLLNIASQAGITPIHLMASYNASKAAVVSFSETMCIELATDNINVSVACPSFVATNLDESLRSKQPGIGKLMTHLLNSGDLTAEQCAQRIIAGERAKQFMIITHRIGKTSYWMKRLLPNSWYLGLLINKAKQMGKVRE